MPSSDSVGFDLLKLFDSLASVEFIVVGGVASTLHGGPRLSMDLDIVPEATDANVAKLAEALAPPEAQVREPGNRHPPVDLRLLQDTARSKRAGQLKTRTKFGPLDILWYLHDGRGFRELFDNTVTLTDDERTLRVLAIETLIEVKRRAGRPQDLTDVRYLEQIRTADEPKK